MSSKFQDLFAWALGGIAGVVEAMSVQNPFSAWNINADRSVYLFAFLSYGAAAWILYRLAFRIRRFRIPRFLSLAISSLSAAALLLCLLYAMVPPYRLAPAKPANPAAPSILLITLDTTRADHLGCYGYDRPTTPFLDSIAKQGVVFEQAYTTATWTLPAHASLFTGLMPSVHGAEYRNFFVSPDLTTMAELLAQKGYTTGGFIGGPFLVSAFNIHQGFDFYDEQLDPHSKLKRLSLFRALSGLLHHPLWVTDGQRRAEELNNQLFPYLDVLPSRRPFFLFLNYFDPHEPYDPPESARKELNVNTTITGHIRHYFIDKQSGVARHMDGTPMTEDEFRQLRALYDAEIRSLDDQLALLWKKLASRGLLENTLVVITADHGESIGDRRLLDHGHTLYQEQVRIPLIVMGPGNWPSGRRVRAPVQIVDIFPTLLEAGGASSPLPIQGRSLQASLKEDGTLPQRPVLAELDTDPHPRFRAFQRSLRMILEDEDKLIEASDQKHELFDLSADAGELDNLITEHPEEAALLRREMNDHFRLLQKMRHQGKGEMDPETREQLKALGYIE